VQARQDLVDVLARSAGEELAAGPVGVLGRVPLAGGLSLSAVRQRACGAGDGAAVEHADARAVGGAFT
jgi:hypothetical protein